MDDILEKAKEVATDILKDFHDDEALAVLEIVKVLIENEG